MTLNTQEMLDETLRMNQKLLKLLHSLGISKNGVPKLLENADSASVLESFENKLEENNLRLHSEDVEQKMLDAKNEFIDRQFHSFSGKDIDVYDVIKDEFGEIYLRDDLNHGYSIPVDVGIEFLMNINGYHYFLPLYRRDGFLFFQNKVQHIDELDEGLDHHCPLCKESIYNYDDGNLCKVLSERTRELIDKIKTKSNYRLRGIMELQDDLHDYREAFDKINLTYDENLGRWIEPMKD